MTKNGTIRTKNLPSSPNSSFPEDGHLASFKNLTKCERPSKNIRDSVETDIYMMTPKAYTHRRYMGLIAGIRV